jgi:hypothetical protein
VTRVTSDAATVVWTGPETAAVCHAPDGSTARADAATGRRGTRVAHVAGLAPDRRYVCTLEPGGRRRVRFRTAPSDAGAFTFAVAGDTGDGSVQAAALARRILAGRPAFFVHLGDFAYPKGTASQFDARFFRPFRRLLARVPIFPTPGNHDLRARSVYRTLFAPAADRDDGDGPRYAFDWGPAHLVSVASPAVAKASPTLAWLGEDLAATSGRPWRIVFLHEPVYTSGTKATVAGLRAALEPVLEKAGVELVLTGHEHFYERSLPACQYVREASVLHVISGGGNDNLDAERTHPNFARVLSTPHYVRVHVTPERLDIRAIGLDGHVLDHAHRRRGERVACRADGWPLPRDR